MFTCCPPLFFLLCLKTLLVLVKRHYRCKHPERVEWQKGICGEETKCMRKKKNFFLEAKQKQLRKKMQLSYLNPLSLTGETSCNGGSPSCRTLSPELTPVQIYLTLVRTNVSDCCLGYFRSRQVDTETRLHSSYRRPAFTTSSTLLPPVCPQLSQPIKEMVSQTTRSRD